MGGVRWGEVGVSLNDEVAGSIPIVRFFFL